MSRRPRAPSEAVIEVRGLCNRFGSQSVHENLDLDLYKTSLGNPDAPPEGPFRVSGEVVYARPLGKECRLGMRITQMDEVVSRFLQKFISVKERRQNPRIPFQ